MKQIGVLNERTATARLVFVQSWTVTIQKSIGLKSVGHFLKESDLFMLIKDQNNSNQPSLLIGAIGIRGTLKLMYPVSLHGRSWSF